jgi:hypothetical protein
VLSLLLSIAAPAFATEELEPEPEPTAAEEASEGPTRGVQGEKAWLATPLVSYDSNLKFGLGAYGEYVKADPSGERPFLFKFAGQAFATTGGFIHPYLRLDLPGLGGTKWRWAHVSHYYRWTQAPYYGLGNDTRRLLDEPEDYNWYDQTRLWFYNALRYPLSEDWSLYAILDLEWSRFTVYEGSRLEEDLPAGVEGGRYVRLALGGFRDTRSDEIDPWDGHVLELSVRGAHPWIGSTFTTGGAYLGLSGWRLAGSRAVLVGRALADVALPGEPFHKASYLGGLSWGVVGGRWILRGLAEERLRGDGTAALQGEVRVSFAEHTVRKTHVRWMAVPFADLGQVWLWDDPALDPRLTGGLGVRWVLNGLLVLRADTALAFERYEDGSTRPQVQFYVLGDHPF